MTSSTYDTSQWSEANRAAWQDQEQRDRMTATIAQHTTDGRPEDQVDTVLGVLSGEFNAADRWQDPDLRPEAETARRQQMRQLATAIAAASVTKLAATAAREADTAYSELGGYLLRAADTDATAAGLAWQHSVLPTLDASPVGAVDWDRVIGNADTNELAAILRFGKSWVRRSIPGNLMPETRDAQADQTWAAVADAVQRRHIAIHPDNAAREALSRAQRSAATASTTKYAADLLNTGRVTTRQQLSSASLTVKSAALLAGSTVNLGGRA